MKVDVRGLSCPEPVMQTKRALENDPLELTILVDNNVAKENVSKLLHQRGYTLTINEEDSDIMIYGKK